MRYTSQLSYLEGLSYTVHQYSLSQGYFGSRKLGKGYSIHHEKLSTCTASTISETEMNSKKGEDSMMTYHASYILTTRDIIFNTTGVERPKA